jgi:hypothetical protein
MVVKGSYVGERPRGRRVLNEPHNSLVKRDDVNLFPSSLRGEEGT